MTQDIISVGSLLIAVLYGAYKIEEEMQQKI